MKDYIISLFNKLSEKLEYIAGLDLTFSAPAQETHGDLSTNVAMTLTKKLRKNPRQIAAEITDALDYDERIISKIEIAGPGFINFFFNPEYVASIVPVIIREGENYGRSVINNGKSAIVEFVSANPTGPLTVGHGRNAVIGDTIATMLEWTGYKVDREYYFNNAGRQMRILGESLRLRYMALCGEENEFPEEYYQGEYLVDIARSLFEREGDSLKNNEVSFFKDIAEREIFRDIENTLSNINIKMKSFFNEHSLYEDGKIEEVLKSFQEKNLSYEKEGAKWLKLTELGMEQDKVMVKSTGEPTYRLPDIAYHITKFEREYDLIVDLFGSDHAATYPDVMAALKALGYDTEKVKVLIHQFVTIMEGKEVVKMSTRKANFITLDELTEEVGRDVVRYFFIMRGISSHLNFDLQLAKKHSDENPVFYLQYAHARICSILRMADKEGLEPDDSLYRLLTAPSEITLMKKLHQFPGEILYSTSGFEPHRIANYLEELAALFHKFYTECRIIGVEKDLSSARMALAIAVQTVLKNGLGILGLSAPDRM